MTTAWTALAVFLAMNVPLFVAQPLTADAVLFDLEARNVFGGGIAYREIFQTNPPGTLWIHMAVRSAFGWSSEVLRLVDLLVFASIVGLSIGWIRLAGRTRVYQIWTALALFFFYMSLTIWSHCQRDMWMLLPALAALALRTYQAGRVADAQVSALRIFVWSALEGLLWAAAFWIKPFVAVPGAVVILMGTACARRGRVGVADILGVLSGGLVSGAIGLTWMWSTGALEWFWITNRDWNQGYWKVRTYAWTPGHFGALAAYFGPWFMAHLLAVVFSCLRVTNWWRRHKKIRWQQASSVAEYRLAMLSAFYLAWMFQAFALQHWHGYVHAPGVLLAIVVVATESSLSRARLWLPVLSLLLVSTVAMSPLIRWDRIACWPQCVTGNVTPEIRDRVRGPLTRMYPGDPDCADLAKVAAFLRSKQLEDGHLMCFSYSVMYLYKDLNLRPPCQFVCPRIYALLFFVDRQQEIHELVEASPQRYIVTDLVLAGMTGGPAGPAGPDVPPPGYPTDAAGLYPWSHPVVFRAGRYLVHQYHPPMGQFGKLPVGHNREP